MTHIKEIPEDIGEYLRYEDGKLFWTQRAAQRLQIGDEAGGLYPKIGYRRVKFRDSIYLTHRIIWFLIKKEQPPRILDHINNNKTDNRIENLREVTYSENEQNKNKQKNNTSGVKGVFWCTRDKKWIARVAKNRKRTCVGYFSDLKDAEQAVKQARKELHGEFANNG